MRGTVSLLLVKELLVKETVGVNEVVGRRVMGAPRLETVGSEVNLPALGSERLENLFLFLDK